MKTFYLLIVLLFCSCSQLATKENRLQGNIFKLHGHNLENQFNSCNSFLIAPDELITANHCITNNLNLSFITFEQKTYFFDKIVAKNPEVDTLHLKLKKPIEINSLIPEAEFPIQKKFSIGLIKNDYPHIISCELITNDDVLIPHGKCSEEIKKGYSGAIILNDEFESIGVLIGVDKIDPTTVYFSLI